MDRGTDIGKTTLQELYLLGRDAAANKLDEIFAGKSQELCLRTRFPREVKPFVAAYLVRRGELDRGAGERCFFIRDRESWRQQARAAETPSVLVADPELDFEAHRSELLKEARAGTHSVVYALTSPRPDINTVTDLRQPERHEVEELLKKHGFAPARSQWLATASNGNVYLLSQLLAGTTERRKWAASDVGPRLRHLALLGGWNDSAARDKSSIAAIVGEPYESWTAMLYPYTRQEEPPAILDGTVFRPLSRYEVWQQLGNFLTASDLRRFHDVSLTVLREIDPALNLPKEQRQYAGLRRQKEDETHSHVFRRGIAETLALLGGQRRILASVSTFAGSIAEQTVYELLHEADWKQWASLNDFLPLLAEAAPTPFISAVEASLQRNGGSELKALFGATEEPILGRSYHTGLLWALETLAWHPDYITRAVLCLGALAEYPLPGNWANNGLNSLRHIFLSWLPQTLAPVEKRSVAIRAVVRAYPEIGWKLLMSVLPEAHQIGHFNPKPIWRDWFKSDWTGEVTRHEMTRQVKAYAELAVESALGDLTKLDELIGRWNYLPREAVDAILGYLASPIFLDRPENERFVVWERLVDEIEKHRKYKDSDWAMPEDELQRLEEVAKTIAPQTASIRHERLFNEYDHHFFQSDDYDAERSKLAKLREDAVRDMKSDVGLTGLLKIAERVKQPTELGSSAGRIGDDESDRFLLPNWLLESEGSRREFVRGYVWNRHFAMSAAWMEKLDLSNWTVDQKAQFFSFLPFHAAVWRLAETQLGDRAGEYWNRIYPNAFQAGEDLDEAVRHAIRYSRGDIAVSGINCLRFNKKTVSTSLVLSAVNTLLGSYRKGMRLDQHELIEAIKLLQAAPDVDVEALTLIEFKALNVLDRHFGAAPVTLERRLSTEPEFFHTMLTRAFRSENEASKREEGTSEEQEFAGHVFRLLYKWRTPPGTLKDGTLDGEVLTKWVRAVKVLCIESGHWTIAQQLIGTALVYAPAGLEGLLTHRQGAEILDSEESEEMRRGFTTGLFNLRGVHGFTAGKEELELANTYDSFAEKYETQGYIRIATTLRGLADSYKRQAEQEAKRDPFG